MNIIGISAYFHDSAACLVRDGKILAAAEEERFTRVKHDSSFPARSLKYLSDEYGLSPSNVAAVVYYEKPFLKFDRLLENTLAFVPRGLSFFQDSFPTWLNDKLFLKQKLKKELRHSGLGGCDLFFGDHHLSHAASAFYPSPFEEAAVMCLDGVGEWTTTSLWMGRGRQLEPLVELTYPHSLGLFYSAITAYCGFKVNSDEYKVMGLAPYGRPTYQEILEKHFIHMLEDGSFHLNMKGFDFGRRQRMLDLKWAADLLGFPARVPGSELGQAYCDLAHSAQKVTEKIVLRLAQTLKKKTGMKKLCLAGGVALNCVANGLLAEQGLFEDIWIQPAAGDSGGSLGAALSYFYQHQAQERVLCSPDSQQGSLLGPHYNREEIELALKDCPYSIQRFDNREELYEKMATLLERGQMGGFFQGRMEFGPRALGARSIIADPRLKDGQSKLNLLIKFRESFRPFAPAILEEHVKDYFDFSQTSPFMLKVAKLRPELRVNQQEIEQTDGVAKLKVPTSDIPAVVHVDYSARLQTLSERHHPEFTKLVRAFYKKTGCPILVNTSFNVQGEPIVCSPQEALSCFEKTGLHFLALEHALIQKEPLDG